MPTRFLKRGTPKTKSKATKGATPAPSPPESERQNSEVKEILALVKESEGGTNLSAVRQRRLSKERPEGAGATQQRPRRMSKEAVEAAQINQFVKAVKQDPAVIRERRSSYEQAAADAKALRESRKSKAVVDLSDSSGSDTDRSSIADTPRASTSVAPTNGEAAPAPAAAPAPPAAAPVSAPAPASPEEESAEQKLARLLQPINNTHLTGAAARGAQAAQLSRVKAAAAAVGGVYLTADEWDQTRAELAQLRFQKDKLTKALKEKEKKPEKQLQISIAKENSSPNFLRKMASRIPASPLTRAASGLSPHSPLWRSSNNSSNNLMSPSA